MKRILIGAAFASVFGLAQAATVLDANFNTENNFNYANSITGFGSFLLGSVFEGGSATSRTFTGVAAAGLRNDPSNFTSNQWVENPNAQTNGGFSLNRALSLVDGASYTLSYLSRGLVVASIGVFGSTDDPLRTLTSLGTSALNTSTWDTNSLTFIWNDPINSGASLGFSLTSLSAIDNVLIVDTVSAVPEPGEWAMMLAGLGVVGAIARRRKSKSI